MKNRVMQAIRERRLLRLSYEKRKHLTVAPQLLGQTMTGYLAVLCWQAGPAAEEGTNWCLLDMARIRNAEVLPEHFGPPPQNWGARGVEFRALEAVV